MHFCIFAAGIVGAARVIGGAGYGVGGGVDAGWGCARSTKLVCERGGNAQDLGLHTGALQAVVGAALRRCSHRSWPQEEGYLNAPHYDEPLPQMSWLRGVVPTPLLPSGSARSVCYSPTPLPTPTHIVPMGDNKVRTYCPSRPPPQHPPEHPPGKHKVSGSTSSFSKSNYVC